MNLVRLPFLSMTTPNAIQQNSVSQDFENICSADYGPQQISEGSDVKYMLNAAHSYFNHCMQSETEDENKWNDDPKGI